MQPSFLSNFFSQTLPKCSQGNNTICSHDLFKNISYFVMQLQTSKRLWPYCGIVLFSDRVTSSQRVPKWQFSLSDGCSLIWPSTNLRTNPQCSGISFFVVCLHDFYLNFHRKTRDKKKEYTYILCYFATPKKLLLECILRIESIMRTHQVD